MTRNEGIGMNRHPGNVDYSIRHNPANPRITPSASFEIVQESGEENEVGYQAKTDKTPLNRVD